MSQTISFSGLIFFFVAESWLLLANGNHGVWGWGSGGERVRGRMCVQVGGGVGEGLRKQYAHVHTHAHTTYYKEEKQDVNFRKCIK